VVNTSIIVAVLGLIGSVAAVIIANRYTARTARRAADATERMEERKLDASTWKDQYEGWREDALKLRELRDADQARYENDRAHWEAKLNECNAKIDQLQQQMAVVARERVQEQAYLDALVAWCRVVVALLRQAGIAYPPVPPGITDTDPRGFRSIYDHRPAPPPPPAPA
jgi:hypothetical protein